MKVSKAQVQTNRARIVETACALFRERGYDGVGIADLMAAAGLTHGGFYKHFASKAELMVEVAACSIAQTAYCTEGKNRAAFLDQYLSRAHRDAPAEGCTLAALAADAARQPEAVKAAFAAGLESVLSALAAEGAADGSPHKDDHCRARAIDTLAHAVGAVILSRACPDDSALADEVLQACRAAMLAK